MLDRCPHCQKVTTTESLKGLTPRQSEVVSLLAQGLTNAQIAERLTITSKTIKFHLTTIFKALKVKSRTQLMALYFAQK